MENGFLHSKQFLCRRWVPSLAPHIQAKQNLELIARLSPGLHAGRIDEILYIIGLEKASNRGTSEFSAGMKQRLGIGMAILLMPALLILDESTNSMDPAGMRDIRNMINALA